MRVISLLNLSITVFTPNYSEEHEGNVKLHFFNHKMSQKLNRKKNFKNFTNFKSSDFSIPQCILCLNNPFFSIYYIEMNGIFNRLSN